MTTVREDSQSGADVIGQVTPISEWPLHGDVNTISIEGEWLARRYAEWPHHKIFSCTGATPLHTTSIPIAARSRRKRTASAAL